MLQQIPNLKSLVSNLKDRTLITLNQNLDPLSDLVGTIDKAMAEDPPMALVDGGVIKKGYSTELDDIRDWRSVRKTGLQDFSNRSENAQVFHRSRLVLIMFSDTI